VKKRVYQIVEICGRAGRALGILLASGLPVPVSRGNRTGVVARRERNTQANQLVTNERRACASIASYGVADITP
jgi:hypothetical protein